MPYTFNPDYKGSKLLDLVSDVLWHLGQVSSGGVSYQRFPKDRVINAINRAQQWVNKYVPSILKINIVNTTANYGWYKCAPNMIPGGLLRAYVQEDATSLKELILLDRPQLDAKFPSWRYSSAGTPEYLVPSSRMFGNRFTFELYPKPNETSTWIPPQTIGTGAAPKRSHVVTGFAVTGEGGSSHTVLYGSSTTNFINLGVQPGMVVTNIRRLSSAVISQVAAGSVTHASMTYAWEDDDPYEISTDYLGVVSDWNLSDDDIWIYGAGLMPVSSLSPAVGNIISEYYAMPLDLSIDDDYPQVPKYLQSALVYKASAILAMTGHEKTRLQELAIQYERLAKEELEPYIGAQRLWPVADKTVQVRPEFPKDEA